MSFHKTAIPARRIDVCPQPSGARELSPKHAAGRRNAFLGLLHGLRSGKSMIGFQAYIGSFHLIGAQQRKPSLKTFNYKTCVRICP